MDRPTRAERSGSLAGLCHLALLTLRLPCPWQTRGLVDAGSLPLAVAHSGDGSHLDRGWAMRVLVIGCSFRTTPVALRERLAFDAAKLTTAMDELGARYGCEAVMLSTCNRVELYLAQEATQPPLNAELLP